MQLCRVSWCVADAGAFFFIQEELPMSVARYVIHSQLFLLLDIANVYAWSNKCQMLLLSHREPCNRQFGMEFINASAVKCRIFVSFLYSYRCQVAHINCGNCRTMLMYPNGAPSVKCAVCHYVTSANMASGRIQPPMNRPNGGGSAVSYTASSMPPLSQQSHSQTVVVENPMSVNESGKLVSNVVVGVTTDKK
ncbi:Protein LSD1 [Linum perenne]